MAIKRYAPFILLNILISAAVVLGILYVWDQNQVEEQQIATATSVAATAPVETAAAVATASAPPPLTATPERVTHVVQAGETLGTIAEEYDVPWEDIARYNNLVNPNVLEIGQELIIPIGGIPTETPVPSPSPTSAEPPTPIPTEPPAAGEVKLVIRDVVGVGNLNEEAVVIANEGSRGIQLVGWQLQDSQGNVYVFKPLYIFGDGVNVMLHSRSGDDTTSDLYWGLNVPTWESGETVTLRDADGTARATYTIP
jgi:competence protein ComEC